MFEKLRRKAQEAAEEVFESESVATGTDEENNSGARYRVEITVSYNTATAYYRINKQPWVGKWAIYDTKSKYTSSVMDGFVYSKREDDALTQAQNIAKSKIEELRLLAKAPIKKTFYL